MVFEWQINKRAWASLKKPYTVIKRAVNAALQTVGKEQEPLSLSVSLNTDAEVSRLNGLFRGKPYPTNVLSFPSAFPILEGAGGILGEIILANGVVLKESIAQGKSLENHTTHLIIHGIFHLFGYDHETDKEAEKMEALEISTLKHLGIDDPYHLDRLRNL